jgi:hypothetical protein
MGRYRYFRVAFEPYSVALLSESADPSSIKDQLKFPELDSLKRL